MNIGLGLFNLIGGLTPLVVAFFVDAFAGFILIILAIVNLLFMAYHFDGFKSWEEEPVRKVKTKRGGK